MQLAMKKVINTDNLAHSIIAQYNQQTHQLEVVLLNEKEVEIGSSSISLGDLIPTPEVLITTLGVEDQAIASIDTDPINNTWTFHFGIPRGEKGEKGDKGDKGEDAVLPEVAAEATALPAGSQPTATIVDEDGKWKFTLGIPTGGSSVLPEVEGEIEAIAWEDKPYVNVETVDDKWVFKFGIPCGSHVEIDEKTYSLKITERA